MAIDSDATRTTLFGPNEGWSLEPIGAWLLTEGRTLSDPVVLVAELMRRIDAAGAQVDRIRVGSETLHPQLIAWSVLWNRKFGARVETVDNGLQMTDAYIGSPMQCVREENRPFRRRLDSPVGDEEHNVLHEMQATGMTDYVAVPLLLGSGAVVSMTLATAAPAILRPIFLAPFAMASRLCDPRSGSRSPF